MSNDTEVRGLEMQGRARRWGLGPGDKKFSVIINWNVLYRLMILPI